MKYFEKNRKLIPFLQVWRRDDDENGGFLERTWWVCERDEWTRKWTVKVNEGKLKSFLKLSLKCKTRDFHDWYESWTSCQGKLPKTFVTKFGKICLSVFRDWKVHPRGSHEGSHECFWVNLTTGASSREQVAKLSRVKSKNPYFWKNSKIFSRLELWPTRKSWKPSV